MRVIGIDPSLRHTGLALVDIVDSHVTVLSTQTIDTGRCGQVDALFWLHQDALVWVTGVKADLICIESTIAGRRGSSEVVARAAGAVLAAMHPALGLVDVSPTAAKAALTGSGRSDKSAMIRSAGALIGDGRRFTEHVADAIGVAIAGYNTWRKRNEDSQKANHPRKFARSSKQVPR